MLDRLFSPLEIGPVRIKNRIQVTPHEQQYFEDGLPTETLLNYYLERARGGAGLLEVSQIYVKSPFGIRFPNWKTDSARRFPMLNSAEIVPGLRKLSEAIHAYGSKIFMEVSAFPFLYGPVSAVPFETGVQQKEITAEDIAEIQQAVVTAAKYVKDSGFDGVDLHGTHGALIEHFYSPLINRRQDKYGGNLENRLRFLLELIEMIRGNVGDSMALGMRLCGDEKMEGGVTPEYAAKMAELLDGKLDFINVDRGSVGGYPATNQLAFQTAPLYVAPGYGTYMSAAVKKAVRKTKIGLAGKITDPLLADSILQKGEADYLGMTRALIADPFLPKKASEGRFNDIRPCIGTLQDCWGRAVAHEWPMRCTVNPTVGREIKRTKLERAEKSKNILIIGSGPAGLEAARVATERGHRVVIYEKRGSVGGQVNLGSLLPGRADIRAIISWYEVQLRQLGVRIELNKEVTPSRDVAGFLVSEEKVDALIIATGSSPVMGGMQMMTFREVEGWNNPNVHSIDEILESKKKLVGNVVVVDSTTYIEGPGIAEWLIRNGANNVTLVTPHLHISPELVNYNQLTYVIQRIDEAGIKVKTLSWIKRIENKTKLALIYNIPSRKEEAIPADHVVLNTGRRQVGNDLGRIFQGLVKEIYEIGDCNIAGGRMGGAIDSGFQIGSSI